MLKKYYGDGDKISYWDSDLFNKDISYEDEPIAILHQEMRKLRTSVIPSVKV